MKILPLSEIVVREDRQRKDMGETEDMFDTLEDIAIHGLYTPIIVREENGQTILTAGGRRTMMVGILHEHGIPVKFDGELLPLDHIPTVSMGELTFLEAEEVELGENIHRRQLSWQEQVDAYARLEHIRSLEAEANGTPPPTISSLVAEIAPTPQQESSTRRRVTAALAVSSHLNNPKVAKAPTLKAAMREVEKIKTREHRERLAKDLPSALVSKQHDFLLGDALTVEWPHTYHLAIVDPPYGIDAHEFGAQSDDHDYDDSHEKWLSFTPDLLHKLYVSCHIQAHAYIFCSIDTFFQIKEWAEAVGWEVWPRPIIWDKGNVGTAPRPEHGPRYCYEAIVFLIKGKKKVNSIFHDVIRVPGEQGNKEHAAQKPVAVYHNLMERSILPGNRVIDPTCGRGTIFLAATQFKAFATGIEKNPVMATLARENMEK